MCTWMKADPFPVPRSLAAHDDLTRRSHTYAISAFHAVISSRSPLSSSLFGLNGTSRSHISRISLFLVHCISTTLLLHLLSSHASSTPHSHVLPHLTLTALTAPRCLPTDVILSFVPSPTSRASAARLAAPALHILTHTQHASYAFSPAPRMGTGCANQTER